MFKTRTLCHVAVEYNTDQGATRLIDTWTSTTKTKQHSMTSSSGSKVLRGVEEVEITKLAAFSSLAFRHLWHGESVTSRFTRKGEETGGGLLLWRWPVC
jgi:hypothetical protein